MTVIGIWIPDENIGTVALLQIAISTTSYDTRPHSRAIARKTGSDLSIVSSPTQYDMRTYPSHAKDEPGTTST